MAVSIIATVGGASSNTAFRRGQTQAYGAGKALLTCAGCGRGFRRWLSQCGPGETYCSKFCHSRSLAGKPAHNKNKTVRVARACVECGGLMFGISSLMRKRRFCSSACFGANKSGPNSPAWRGGISSARIKLQNSPEYKEWRRAVVLRDRGRCRQCDAMGVRTYRSLEVHHVIPVAADWSLALEIDNGITLCHEHHVATLGRENQSAEYFAALLGLPLIALPSANRKDRTPLDADAPTLRRLYEDEKKSTPEIGALFGVTSACVRKHLVRHGIPRRSPTQARWPEHRRAS